MTVGVLIGLTPVYALRSSARADRLAGRLFGFIEGGQGLGSLVGGFLIGLVGVRFAKGRMIIAGYTVSGCCTS